MHAALWKLYRLRVRGSIRSMVGKLKSVRGAALAVFTLLVLGMMFGPNLAMAFKLGRARSDGPKRRLVRRAGPRRDAPVRGPEHRHFAGRAGDLLLAQRRGLPLPGPVFPPANPALQDSRQRHGGGLRRRCSSRRR